MRLTHALTSAFASTLAAGLALGGVDVWPQANGPMSHILIDFDGTNISLSAPGGPMTLADYGETHNNPADVLDGKAYNDQYGWLADGIFSPPANTGIFVELMSTTPGLEIYEGGMRPMRATHSYDPIFGTAGSDSSWMWGGAMTHNWVATTSFGDFSATFDVYIGDLSTGERLPGYGDDTVTLEWTRVPAPASVLSLAPVGILALRRRR